MKIHLITIIGSVPLKNINSPIFKLSSMEDDTQSRKAQGKKGTDGD